MTADDRPAIDVPQTLAFHAKALAGVLPEGMKTLIVAFDEAVPELPLMACNASRAATLAVLRKMIVDIEKAPANRQERRAEAAQEKAQAKGPGRYGSRLGLLWQQFPSAHGARMKKAFYAGAGSSWMPSTSSVPATRPRMRR